MRRHDRLFIGGDWVAPDGSERLTVVSRALELEMAAEAQVITLHPGDRERA